MTDTIGTLTRRVLFSPLSDSGRTEVVVDKIRAAITLGVFADGEQLPNEIELAAQLQVSPVTLRDALKVIRKEGLARTTRGRSGGTFAIAPDDSHLLRIERQLASIAVIELRDSLDWLASLTSHSAYLAAARASPSEVRTLTVAAEQITFNTNATQSRRNFSRFLIGVSATARSGRLTREMITHLIDIAPILMLVLRAPDVRRSCHQVAVQLVETIGKQDQVASQYHAVALIELVSEKVLELHHRLAQPELSRSEK